MATPLTITATPAQHGPVTLTIAGEIDMSNAAVLAAAIEAQHGPLIVELTDVHYLDSAGLSVLFAHAERLEVVVPALLAPVVAIAGLGAVALVHGPNPAAYPLFRHAIPELPMRDNNFPNRHDVRMSGERASVAVHQVANAVVVTVAGEIDMTTAPALERAVRQSLAEHPATLIIDLTGAQFFSSAGIAVLVLAHRHSNGTALRVVAADRVVLRPLELTGLVDDLAIRATVEAALAG